MTRRARCLHVKELALASLVLSSISSCSPARQADESGRAPTAASAQEARANRNFTEAVSDLSTNTSFVAITVTDTNTGVTRSGCTTANGLLGAIHRERGIGYDEKSVRTVQDIALAAPGHRFAFASKDALANVGFARLETQFPEECALIRDGWSASRGDIGYLLFTDKPGYRQAGE